MQTNQANTRPEFAAQQAESSFSSVWGNEMQREDFLALASGLRQFSANQADAGFGPAAGGYVTAYKAQVGQFAAE
jgi:hypothetical protein